MLPQILSAESFEAFAAYLAKGARLVAPVAKGPQYAFAEVGADELKSICMDYSVSILPPKKFILPQEETLLSFKSRSPAGVEAEVKSRPTVLLGAHPYDLAAIQTLDEAMLKAPADPYYAARRQAITLIGVNNSRYVNDNQFMTDMGAAEAPEGSYDLLLTDLGDRYYVEVGSDKGKALLDGSKLAKPAGVADHEAKKKFDEAKKAAMPKRLPYDVKYLPELLEESYDSLLWDAISARCFSCGTCTNVCPTCYCFDVQDKLNIDVTSGRRQRRWDSCQLEVFAEVSGGENFREGRANRLRHRMFRKGKYVLEQTGKPGCVGCGRCINHCVAAISILEAFQQIADEGAELKAGDK